MLMFNSGSTFVVKRVYFFCVQMWALYVPECMRIYEIMQDI